MQPLLVVGRALTHRQQKQAAGFVTACCVPGIDLLSFWRQASAARLRLIRFGPTWKSNLARQVQALDPCPVLQSLSRYLLCGAIWFPRRQSSKRNARKSNELSGLKASGGSSLFLQFREHRFPLNILFQLLRYLA